MPQRRRQRERGRDARRDRRMEKNRASRPEIEEQNRRRERVQGGGPRPNGEREHWTKETEEPEVLAGPYV